jgi:hypothetical protein
MSQVELELRRIEIDASGFSLYVCPLLRAIRATTLASSWKRSSPAQLCLELTDGHCPARRGNIYLFDSGVVNLLVCVLARSHSTVLGRTIKCVAIPMKVEVVSRSV